MMDKVFFIGANNPEIERMMRAVQRSRDVEFLGFLDNDESKQGKEFCGLPVMSDQDVCKNLDPSAKFVNLITRDCPTRFETTQSVLDLNFKMASFIHPSVDLTMTKVSVGAYIQEAVVLQAMVNVGQNCSIHMGSLIGHETRVGDHTFIAHGVTVSGCITIGIGCFIGAGATLLPRIEIGNGCVIGAGAVVTKDVPAWSVAVGNPARVIKSVPVRTYSRSS